VKPKPAAAGPVRVRATLIFEFPPADDWMARTLIESLKGRLPGLEMTGIHGIFPTYRPGGLRPRRVLNLLWIYFRTALHLTLGRPDSVIVRSSPPGIQVWTQWWARVRGIPVICWLMDYHPEMEARALERKGWRRMSRLLRRIDADAMRRFALVVTLDRAMAKLARSRAGAITVTEHPTWGMHSSRPAPPSPVAPTRGGALRLAYSGNLGAAHDLTVAGRLLAACARRSPVELYVIGASPAGIERFRAIGRSADITVVAHARVAFDDLPLLYHRWRIVAGVVLLAEESAGLVSPSKFSGYIDFGLPIIYVGPPDTNTAEICATFKAGFWLTNHASAADVDAVVENLFDPARLSEATGRSDLAARHFQSFNQDSLAAILAPYLNPAGNR
jgi:hypothetical protein